MNDIRTLARVVTVLGLGQQLNGILGADAFYDTLAAQNQEKAYHVAQQPGDPDVLAGVTERIIKSIIGSIDLESVVSEISLSSARPAISQQVPPEVQSAQSQFSIESLEDRYRIYGLMYQGRVHTADISKELLDNGQSHTQFEWIQMTKQAEWKLASAPLYFVVMDALYENRNHPDNVQKSLVEEIRAMFANDFRQYFMTTSTRILYKEGGRDLDVVAHDVGYASMSAEQVSIVGPDAYITEDSCFGATMQALMGISDCNRFLQVGNWFTKGDYYLWHVNPKPDYNKEHALYFIGYNDYDWDGFSAYEHYFLDCGHARGMVAHPSRRKFSIGHKGRKKF